MTRIRDEEWTYYQALRAKVKIESISSHSVMILVGFVIAAIVTHFDAPWPGLVTFTLLFVWTVVLIASATGLSYRIQRGDFDEQEDQAP